MRYIMMSGQIEGNKMQKAKLQLAENSNQFWRTKITEYRERNGHHEGPDGDGCYLEVALSRDVGGCKLDCNMSIEGHGNKKRIV